MSRRFVYYQPNKKDVKNKFGDCTVRALSRALNVSWIDAFNMMIPICREYQTVNIFFMPLKLEKQAMKQLGFEYTGISNKRGSKRPTVYEFAKTHNEGTYIVNVAHHVVAIVDGNYYDTWDSGRKCIYGYYERVI